MKKIGKILLLSMVFLLAACAGAETSPTLETPALQFEPKITMFEEGKVHFELGITNEANREQPMIEDANIRAVVTDRAGKIRNQMTLFDLGPISANETVFPTVYEAVYDPGRYTISLTGEDVPSLSFNFTIREEDDVRTLIAPSKFINPFTEFTSSTVEPVEEDSLQDND